MASIPKKEKYYSALYYLSTVFATYYIELIDLMKKDEDNCPELQNLLKAIDEVINASSINTMTNRQKKAIMNDHENFKNLIDKFMRL